MLRYGWDPARRTRSGRKFRRKFLGGVALPDRARFNPLTFHQEGVAFDYGILTCFDSIMNERKCTYGATLTDLDVIRFVNALFQRMRLEHTFVVERGVVTYLSVIVAPSSKTLRPTRAPSMRSMRVLYGVP